jgi:hypothetical protein
MAERQNPHAGDYPVLPRGLRSEAIHMADWPLEVGVMELRGNNTPW